MEPFGKEIDGNGFQESWKIIGEDTFFAKSGKFNDQATCSEKDKLRFCSLSKVQGLDYRF